MKTNLNSKTGSYLRILALLGVLAVVAVAALFAYDTYEYEYYDEAHVYMNEWNQQPKATICIPPPPHI